MTPGSAAELVAALDPWLARWNALLDDTSSREAIADAMDRTNPVYIPRNHMVEDALAAATLGEFEPVRRLVDAVTRPFDERPELAPYAEPMPPGSAPYRTFCGT
jgi:uncharacterized protein YdiU (UPF0061 family)